MRTPEQWVVDIGKGQRMHTPSEHPESLLTVIRAIQSDASRSAARSERERAARVVDAKARSFEEEYNDHSDRGYMYRMLGAYEAAAAVRALPDDNAKSTDGDAGEGEA